MSAKGYSAGTIFLQVSPVFRKFQDDVRDYVRDMDRTLGDEMEKSGEKAGERAGKAMGKKMAESIDGEGEKAAKKYAGHFETNIKGAVRSAQREISRLDLSSATGKMLKDLDHAKAKLAELNDQDFNVDFNSKRVLADLTAVRAAVEAITRGKHEINVQTNLEKVSKDIGKALDFAQKQVEETSRRFKKETYEWDRTVGAFEKSLKKHVDKAMDHLVGSSDRSVKKVHKSLAELSDVRIGIDMSADMAVNEFRKAHAQMKRIASDSIDIEAKFASGKALAEMAALGIAADILDDKDVEIDVKTDKGQAALRGLTRSGTEAANSFRSFNVVLLAVAAVGPALIPILGALAGGLLAIASGASVAAFGIGAVIVGFGGIGDAYKALADRQDDQAKAAADAGAAQQRANYAIVDAERALRDAIRSGAEAAEDAARRVKRAREDAASAVKQALKRQTDAQHDYRDAINDVREAERQLKEARREAATTGDQIDLAIRENALALDQGMLDSFNATVSYNSVIDDGSATNAEKEQARINKERAQMRLDELRAESQKLAADKKKWDKEGVNGTDQVKRAQDALSNAVERQRKAYEAMGEAARRVDRAREDGAERVSDAIRAQNRTLDDNARAIARAREALRRARENANEVYTAVTTGQEKVNEAFAKLGPAGQRFAKFLFGLRQGFFRFRDDIQEVMLPAVQAAMEGFLESTNSQRARRGLIALAAAFGDFSREASNSLQGEAWGKFFDMLASYGPRISDAYGGAFLALFEALASIFTTLAPYALQFAEGFERMMESFAGWAASEEGQAGLQRFMDHIVEIAPAVLDFIGTFALALTNLMVALSPYAGMILGLLIGILDWIAGLDPEILGSFAAGLLIIITSSQLVYGALNIMLAGMVLLGSTFGTIAFLAIALGLAIYYVYTRNETLGKILGVVAGAIFGVIIALKIYRMLMAVMIGLKIGYAIATGGVITAKMAEVAATRAGNAATKAAIFWTNAWLGLKKLTILRTWAQVGAVYALIAAEKALAFVQRMSPIGRVIALLTLLGSAFVLAYKKIDWFRAGIDWIVEKVVGAFEWLWDVLFGHSIMPDIVDGMKWAGDQIAKVFDWIGNVIRATGAAFSWLWTNAVRPALRAIAAYYKFVFGVMKAVWQRVLWPVLRTIGKVVWTLWKAYFKVVLTLIKVAFKATMLALKWVWEKILKPVFDAIARAVTRLWEKAFKPVLERMGRDFRRVFEGMRWVWRNTLKPVFDAIADKALPKLKGAFQTTVDGIKKIWDGLKAVIAKPIKFVIDKIVNRGLIAGFNKVAKWVGMDGFDPIPMPKSLQKYASGGILPGYTPGRDVHKYYSPTGGGLELSGGEAIMRPEFTAAVGPSFVNAANAAARSGGIDAVRRLLAGGQAFAKGGIFWPVRGGYASRSAYNLSHDGMDINHARDTGNGQGGVVPFVSATGGKVSYVGYDRGYGLATFVRSPYGELVYGHAYPGSIGVRPGQSVNPGQYLGLIGNTGRSSGPHLHFGFPGGSFYQAEALLSGGLQPGKMPPGKGGGSPFPSWIGNLITSPIKTIKGWASKAWSKASDFVSDSPIFDVVKNAPNLLVGGIKDKTMDIIPGWAKSAAGVVGDAISKGKDIVGGAGRLAGSALESVGLADGGILPYNGTMKYDSGGYLPPGLTTVVNLTGKPEPVFTHDQWEGMGRGGEGIHYEPHFEGSNLTSEDVASDLNFTFRRIRRAGKYAGVGDQ